MPILEPKNKQPFIYVSDNPYNIKSRHQQFILQYSEAQSRVHTGTHHEQKQSRVQNKIFRAREEARTRMKHEHTIFRSIAEHEAYNIQIKSRAAEHETYYIQSKSRARRADNTTRVHA